MKSQHSLWTEEELRVAIEAYLYILYLQQHGVSFSSSETACLLISGPLRGRNEASIRYRMRNISWVLREQGWPIIKGYSPAQGVGRNVAVKIQNILDKLPAALPFRKKDLHAVSFRNKAKPFVQEDVAKSLEKLGASLGDISASRAGIGHNNPPEPLDEADSLQRDLVQLRDEVEKLTIEIRKKSPDRKRLKKGSGFLVQSGLKIVLWLGGRFTKFADAAVISIGKALGAVTIAKITGLLPLITDALHALIGIHG